MALETHKLPGNVPGDFFVDASCINCDVCRQLAPAYFTEIDDQSAVARQPQTDDETRQVILALLACPTASIGTSGNQDIKPHAASFPTLLEATSHGGTFEGGVYHCGYTSKKSYGGKSYFIQHPAGNWLIDSPRFVPALVDQLKALGGVQTIFLTHRDDVADAQRYAEAFGALRIIHEAEREAQPDAERLITGTDTVYLGDDFVIIPTPGHTEGHMVLLYNNRYLFTGDHMSWRRQPTQEEDNNETPSWHFGASRQYCWWDWEAQKASLSKLLAYDFEWVLPGHGHWKQLPGTQMKQAMQAMAAFYNLSP
ncbi:MAG: MBL fold metallo-hydrolase [Cyanobacteria bacterium HKST-UBA03]|nr:MBL fold metallo-hydrolase [Cyanobacteria bacterium HKST-UBA03]